MKFLPCVRCFAITGFGSRLMHLSADFIESSTFSFCRLYQRLLNSGETRTGSDQILINLHSLPSWLLREDNVYFTNLSSLTLSQLDTVNISLGPWKRKKSVVINEILVDFNRERLEIGGNCMADFTMTRSECLMVFVSRYFLARYGPMVSAALRDLRLPNHFHDSVQKIQIPVMADCYWLEYTSQRMSTEISKVSKDDILCSLHLQLFVYSLTLSRFFFIYE